MKKRNMGCCPLCDKPYHKKRKRTHHHLFPKAWYKNSPLVEVCSECHREFNLLYPMNYVWPEKTCLKNWTTFCKKKGKKAFDLYPQIIPP